MSNITYADKTQTEPYDPAKFNAQDANEIKVAVNSKVDSISGKGLSTEDYTTLEKSKLATIESNATANDTNAVLKNRANHTGVQNADTVVDGTNNKVFTVTEKTKLSGIAQGATANATDANLRNRATHTGTQDINTINLLQTVLDSKQAVLNNTVNIKSINGTSILGSGDLSVESVIPDNIQVQSIATSQLYMNPLSSAPSSSTSAGTVGDIRFTDSYIYVCIAIDTWKRSALTTW